MTVARSKRKIGVRVYRLGVRVSGLKVINLLPEPNHFGLDWVGSGWT